MNDGVLIALSKTLCFLGWLIIRFKYHIIIHIQQEFVAFSYVSVILSLRQAHAWVFVVRTVHLVFERLVEVFVYVVFLEQRFCLLVTWIPMPNLWDLTLLKL
jgi:hypothetical protein